MRIARLIFIVLFLLGGVGVFIASERLRTAHQLVVAETQLAELAQARSIWLEGTVALSLERSVTQVALALDTSIPDAFRELIDEQRAQSDRLLDQSLTSIEGMAGFENGDEFIAEVARINGVIQSLRREADGLLSQAGPDRDPTRTRDMPYELKAAIEELFIASSLLALQNGHSSTREMVLSRIQALAWEVREFGGRARTFYAIASLTGEPIPVYLTGEARIDTARAVSAWNRIQMETRITDLPEDFLSALSSADEPFAQTYLQALDEMDTAMAAMREGADVTLPYSFEDFFELSNAGLGAAAGIAPLSGTFIQQYWAEELQKVRRARLVNAIIVAVVALMTLSSMYIIYRKLTRPWRQRQAFCIRWRRAISTASSARAGAISTSCASFGMLSKSCRPVYAPRGTPPKPRRKPSSGRKRASRANCSMALARWRAAT